MDAAPDTERTNRIGVGRWLRREIGELFHGDASPGVAQGNTLAAPLDLADDDKISPADAKMEDDEDLRYCPACIDALDYRKEGKRRILFAFPWIPCDATDSANPISPSKVAS